MARSIACDCTRQNPNAPKDVNDYCMCTNSTTVDKVPDQWICSDCSSNGHRWVY